MKSYSSRELITIIENDGWELVGCRGSHWQFKHPTKPGRVTITHPKKDVPMGTMRNVFAQAQIALDEEDSRGDKR